MKPSRKEDFHLVTGQGKFTADWNLPNQLHAHIVRSDRAHARIVGTDWQSVREAPGVVAVLTAEDVAAEGFGEVPFGAPIKGIGGEELRRNAMPVFATDRVRFVGQAVAMVVAETAQQARDAAEQAYVEYEDLPPVSSAAAALAEGAPQLHDSAPGNVSLAFEKGDEAKVAQALASAKHVTRLTIESQRLAGAPMEPRAVVVDHDATSGKTVVYTPTQGINGMLATLSTISKWPVENFEVIAQDVGGSFGLRAGATCEHAGLLIASRRLGRPVKWVSTRSELFAAEWHGRALTLNGTIALDDAGKILAIRFDDVVDLGAYNSYFGGFIGTNNLSITMGGVYAVPALYMRSQLVYSNTTPVNAYRGAGRPDIAFAIECLVDRAAAEAGIDPIELRRRNYVSRDAFPYTTANGTVYDSGDFEGVLDKALALADYAGFAKRQQESVSRGKLRAIGLASYLEASGGGNAPKDEVSCEYQPDGMILLYGVTGPSGQGHETSFAQIVAEGLGLPVEAFDYHASDPQHSLLGNGTGGSRSLYGAGSAFKNLVPAMIETAKPHAAAALGADASTLEYRDGAFRAGAASITLPELARKLAGPSPHPLNCRGEAKSGSTFPNGCHIAEIEVDPQTGSVQVAEYTAVDDLGRVISPQLAQGQVHGGVVQGVGQALGEHVIYDPESGQLLTGSFTDYVMPHAGCLLNFRNDYHLVPTQLNALGAKGVGESGCTGSLPALSNAMNSLLRSKGLPHMDMPFTPAKVWAALSQAS